MIASMNTKNGSKTAQRIMQTVQVCKMEKLGIMQSYSTQLLKALLFS